jgi:hypothetical protein
LAPAAHVPRQSGTLKRRRLRPRPDKPAASPALPDTGALWECPFCRAKLVFRGLSHACGRYSVEKFLAGASMHAQQLFSRFVELIAACGPYEVAPAKTRVAFLASVRFASVNRVRPTHLDVHFVLPRPLSSPRFRRIERLGKLYVHHLRFVDEREMDDEVQRWLQDSYAQYGERRWLNRSPRRTRP